MSPESIDNSLIVQRLFSDPYSFLQPDELPPYQIFPIKRFWEYAQDSDIKRIQRLKKASWVVAKKWLRLENKNIGERLAIVGPPGIGKSTLSEEG
jgi:ABC-type multidrug transport system fused ATPase/permease subunit